MKKIKKYIYPLVFLVGFCLFCSILGFTLNYVLDDGNYGGAVVAVIVVLLTLAIVVPIYCIKYGQLIKNGKLRFLFAAYNAGVLSFSYILPFNLEDEVYVYAACHFIWAMFWSALPLIVRIDSCKAKEKTAENERQI